MRIMVTSLLIWSLTLSPAVAWNAAGHKIIASIAFRQLTGAEQAKIVAILRRHPRFTEDFTDAMPDDMRGADEAMQNEWLFQQAAIWPDLIRGGPPEKQAFNRGEWHYVNVPHFLSDEAKFTLAGTITANVATEVPADATPDTPKMNVVQAIRFARTTAANKHASPQDRALLLAWVFHTVGDIHQPLHAAALFSPRLFPEGDRGGNSIKTLQNGNLHSLWDGFPGRDDSYRGARDQAITYVEDATLSAVGKQARARLDEVAWRDESYTLAKSAVYDAEVLGALRKMEAGSGAAEEISLSDAYLMAGGRVAEPRLVQAGYRLGAVLKRLVAEQ